MLAASPYLMLFWRSLVLALWARLRSNEALLYSFLRATEWLNIDEVAFEVEGGPGGGSILMVRGCSGELDPGEEQQNGELDLSFILHREAGDEADLWSSRLFVLDFLLVM